MHRGNHIHFPVKDIAYKIKPRNIVNKNSSPSAQRPTKWKIDDAVQNESTCIKSGSKFNREKRAHPIEIRSRSDCEGSP